MCNVDRKAVEKIRMGGFEAVCTNAENVNEYGGNADLFLCFELLEHLMDPIGFLRALATQTQAKYLIATVPYVRQSCVALRHIRAGSQEDVYAENTHIFELSPEDWRVIIRHAGWNVFEEAVYLRYPRKGLLRATQCMWRRFDFEGFYGMILYRDDTWASRYKDWQRIPQCGK